MIEKLAPAFIGLAGTAIGAMIVIIGWFISHKLTLERELAAKRRDQRLSYLIPTYRVISKLIPYSRVNKHHELNADFQTAVADIQFLGTAEQVEMCQALVDGIIKEGIINTEPILVSLRDEMRELLGKEKISGPIRWIGMWDKPPATPAPTIPKNPVYSYHGPYISPPQL